MQYMCLIYATEGTGPQPGSPEFGGFMKAYADFTQQVKDDGKFIAGEALEPVNTATTVSKRGGKTEIMDGPFAETKEQLGGYYLLDCENLDEAVRYAAMIPSVEYGRVEVRPIMIFDS
ncbi:MAG: YciI family protein [Methyloligellaceae bacterium]